MLVSASQNATRISGEVDGSAQRAKPMSAQGNALGYQSHDEMSPKAGAPKTTSRWPYPCGIRASHESPDVSIQRPRHLPGLNILKTPESHPSNRTQPPHPIKQDLPKAHSSPSPSPTPILKRTTNNGQRTTNKSPLPHHPINNKPNHLLDQLLPAHKPFRTGNDELVR